MPKINHKFWKNLNLPWTVWSYIVTCIDKVVTIIPGSTHSTWTTGPVKYIHWTHSPSPLTYVLLCIISLCFVSTLYRSSYPWCWPAWYNSKQRGEVWSENIPAGWCSSRGFHLVKIWTGRERCSVVLIISDCHTSQVTSAPSPSPLAAGYFAVKFS